MSSLHFSGTEFLSKGNHVRDRPFPETRSEGACQSGRPWYHYEAREAKSGLLPLEGEVALHSKNRDEVYEAQKDLKEDFYITYSGELPNNGFAVAFYG